jgi:hypothetical protein
MKYSDFIAKFPKQRKLGSGIEGVLVQCPSHEDRSPSLQICRGHDERVLIKCHAGSRA